MNIRKVMAGDREMLLDIWLRSVRATHAFVSAPDIESMIPQVRGYLAAIDADIWVACDESGAPLGFLGMSGSNIDALFLAPESFRRGFGGALVRHARSLHDELTVDVNEQNHSARRFYEASGFVVERRSELDGEGRPYPLLHLRLAVRN